MFPRQDAYPNDLGQSAAVGCAHCPFGILCEELTVDMVRQRNSGSTAVPPLSTVRPLHLVV